MKVFIGADHRGYNLKERIIRWLFEWGYEFEDMGAHQLDPNDDYPVYAERVASMVRDNQESMGILLCGSGVGVDIVANKFDGIRASIGKNEDQVKAGRRDDNMNVLVLASDFTGDFEAKKMVESFIKTKFDALKRHKKRLKEVEMIEKNN